MEHVLIRKLEHLTGTKEAPSLGFAVETRDRSGPAYKEGTSPDDVVWVQIHGGLFVAKGLAEAHGGTLQVEARGGIRFAVRLPPVLG